METCQGTLKPINTSKGNSSRTEEERQPIEPPSPVTRLIHVPELNFVVLFMFGFKTRIDVNTFKHGLAQDLIKHPRFSSKLVFDAKETTKPVGWVRTKLNINDHVVVPDLDSNINVGDKLVEDYMAKIADIPMDLSKPLWEFHVLNVKTSEAASIGLFRIHHSLGDGATVMSVILSCTRKSSDPGAFASLHPAGDKKKNTRSIKFYLAALLFTKMWRNTLMGVAQNVATLMYLRDNNILEKVAPRGEKTPRRLVYKMLSLDDINLIKGAMGVTINDVLMGITQAGLSNYLNKRYGKEQGVNNPQVEYLPKHLRLRVDVIVNIRSTPFKESVAKMMEGGEEGREEWGNKIGHALVPFRIALRDNPLDNIRDIKASMDAKKLSFEPEITHSLVPLFINAVGFNTSVASLYKVFSRITICFSNLVGPKDEISWYGHPVTFFAPGVTGLPQAVMINTMSYKNKMGIVLVVDENRIPDPHNLCEEIVESLKLAKKSIIFARM